MTNRALRQRTGEGHGLPEIPDHARYMLVAFRESGVTKPGAMGAVPLGWPDLLAFADGTGEISRGSDIATLFAMCRAYAGAHDAARGDSLVAAPTEQA